MVDLQGLDAREAGLAGHALGQLRVQAQRAEAQSTRLREGRGHAGENRGAVHHRSHGVLLDVGRVAVVCLDVGDQPDTVRGQGAADGAHGRGGIRHVVQAVEGGDEAEARVAGQRILVGVVEGDVARAGAAVVLHGPGQRVARDVVAVELGLGEGPGHLEQGDAGTAADVGHRDAALERVGQPLDARQDHGHQEDAHPRSEPALDAARAFRPEGVVGQADPALEALRQALRHGQGLRQVGEEAGSEGRVVLVGEHRHALGRELEAVAVAVLEHPGGTLLVEPLAQPALAQPAALGELGARERARLGQDPVQAQAIAQVDHGGGHRPAQGPEDERRVVSELLAIHAAGPG